MKWKEIQNSILGDVLKTGNSKGKKWSEHIPKGGTCKDGIKALLKQY